MNAIEDYDSEIKLVFEQAAAEAALFPVPLNEIGQALIAGCNPMQSSAGSNYISFLLPFWLKEQTASSNVLCRDLAVGNVFAMIHFFLLDDVIDAGEGSERIGVRDALVLGQLFQSLFLQRYNRHFPADSPLWEYYRSYIADWASAVSQEGVLPADPHDPGQLARKSAPVKLCASGMLLLSGQRERIPRIEEAIDLALATLQLSDDWTDWRDDLADENRSAFLTLARERLSLPPGQALDERKVKQAIYRADCLGRLADIVRDNGERLKAVPNVPPGLVAFHETMSEGIRKDASKAEQTTDRLASGGGLSYFLSNTTRN